jgi:dTDP-4-amino-4,6-dideoxygalactose transaminase
MGKMDEIKFNDLTAQWELIRETTLQEIDELGKRGDYIGGSKISAFESEFSDYVGSKFSIGVSNGTDALKISFQMFDLGSKDLVIIPANTFIADYLALKNCPGESPRVCLIDHGNDYTIDVKKLEKFLANQREIYRKVVLVPVHLYGQACDMAALSDLKERYNLLVLEDCSQSHGTTFDGKHVGYLGDISVYSLYPGKNLGAVGDAGVITTNLEQYYTRAKSLRNYGSSKKYHYDELGNNHRLDTIQAVILLQKLKHLTSWTSAKRMVALKYLDQIKNDKVALPYIEDVASHSFHIFCLEVSNRDSFMEYMNSAGIPTIIHYPIPIQETKIFDQSDICTDLKRTNFSKDRIVSIPIHPFLTDTQIEHIIKVINSWK